KPLFAPGMTIVCTSFGLRSLPFFSTASAPPRVVKAYLPSGVVATANGWLGALGTGLLIWVMFLSSTGGVGVPLTGFCTHLGSVKGAAAAVGVPPPVAPPLLPLPPPPPLPPNSTYPAPPIAATATTAASATRALDRYQGGRGAGGP